MYCSIYRTMKTNELFNELWVMLIFNRRVCVCLCGGEVGRLVSKWCIFCKLILDFFGKIILVLRDINWYHHLNLIWDIISLSRNKCLLPELLVCFPIYKSKLVFLLRFLLKTILVVPTKTTLYTKKTMKFVQDNLWLLIKIM